EAFRAAHVRGLHRPGKGLCAGVDKRDERQISMPLYEHVFLARQEVSPQQVEALMKEFGQVITDGSGTVGKTEYWGLKTLAYKIKKSRKAHYALMNIDAAPHVVAEMERQIGRASCRER